MSLSVLGDLLFGCMFYEFCISFEEWMMFIEEMICFVGYLIENLWVNDLVLSEFDAVFSFN
jgi:hypothetical protein